MKKPPFGGLSCLNKFPSESTIKITLWYVLISSNVHPPASLQYNYNLCKYLICAITIQYALNSPILLLVASFAVSPFPSSFLFSTLQLQVLRLSFWRYSEMRISLKDLKLDLCVMRLMLGLILCQMNFIVNCRRRKVMHFEIDVYAYFLKNSISFS